MRQCWKRFIDWLSISNIPKSEESLIRDLKTLGAIE